MTVIFIIMTIVFPEIKTACTERKRERESARERERERERARERARESARERARERERVREKERESAREREKGVFSRAVVLGGFWIYALLIWHTFWST